jgi:glutathione S-transferase
MWARPALKKGADVPEPYTMKEILKDKSTMEKKAAEVRRSVSCQDGRCRANATL